MEQRIGPYLVLRQLGAGAHGVVHEAVDEALGRRVALKLLDPVAGADVHLHRGFAREAAALAALDSRHLVRVHGHGEHDGRLWVASRLMTGGDLDGLVRRDGPLPVPRALALVAQVAAGLADAHEAGLVHRQLTPAHVFVEQRDAGVVAWLGDFALLPSADADDADGRAADIRALGRLLWTTLTGQTSYADGSVPQLSGRSPRQVAVNRILRATLTVPPGYSSAARLRDDLARAASLPHDHRGRVRGRPALTAFATVAAGAAVTVAVLAFPDQVVDPPGRSPAAVGGGGPVTRERVAVDSLAGALVDAGALGPDRARCTARGWIDRVGLERLLAEGFLDDRLRYVDRPAAAMSDPLRSAAAAAALHCRPPTPS